jgi:hypothetical protein
MRVDPGPLVARPGIAESRRTELLERVAAAGDDVGDDAIPRDWTGTG